MQNHHKYLIKPNWSLVELKDSLTVVEFLPWFKPCRTVVRFWPWSIPKFKIKKNESADQRKTIKWTKNAHQVNNHKNDLENFLSEADSAWTWTHSQVISEILLRLENLVSIQYWNFNLKFLISLCAQNYHLLTKINSQIWSDIRRLDSKSFSWPKMIPRWPLSISSMA